MENLAKLPAPAPSHTPSPSSATLKKNPLERPILHFRAPTTPSRLPSDLLMANV
jgi:hypothetical protein